jgi:hypothetical protein
MSPSVMERHNKNSKHQFEQTKNVTDILLSLNGKQRPKSELRTRAAPLIEIS